MVFRSPALPQAVAACLLLLISSPTRAAEAGAWEAFPSEANSDAWTVYDGSDGQYYYPFWFNDSGDGFAYFFHTGSSPLVFFTDVENNAGGGKLVGDYAAQNITAIQVDVLIDSLEDFDGIDCIVTANGPAGVKNYYSEVYYDTDFAESGWYTLRFSFSDTWYYYDSVVQDFVSIAVTQQLLQTIELVGFRFFLKNGTTSEPAAAIDNIKLEPTITPPKITTSQAGGNFSMTFTPGTGVTCTVEKQDPPPNFGWSVIAEAFDITGTTPFTFSTPLLPPKSGEVFRLSYDPIYTPFVTIPPE